MTVKELYNSIENKRARSAWDKGVKAYALELLDEVMNYGIYDECGEIASAHELKTACLNGAENWREYSEGGGALIYDVEIAHRLCTPSELKRTNYGLKDPNGRENWIQCQARALYQAWALISESLRFGGVRFSLATTTAAEVAK